MARKAQTEERREQFARYKEDVKREGKPFFPYAMWHDTIMALVVVVVIIALACVWYFTGQACGRRRRAARAARHATRPIRYDDFVPRPDWYFYFLFYLLRIFKWPDTVLIGTVGIPKILLVILIGCRSSTAVGAAVLPPSGRAGLGDPGRDVDGHIDLEGRDGEGVARLETIQEVLEVGRPSRAPRTTRSRCAAKVFASLACLTCHTYLGWARRTRCTRSLRDRLRGSGVPDFSATSPNPLAVREQRRCRRSLASATRT